VSATGVGFTTVNIYDAANQSTALTGVTVSTTSSSITFVSSIDQEVSGSKTYVVKANLTGSPVAGNSFAVNIPQTGSFAAPNVAAAVSATNSFIWSDESIIGHSFTTADWMGDYLVKNLPTDSETMTK
jgi:UDP-N-acetylmuramyl tripeptide synthase